MKIIVTLFKRSPESTATLSAPCLPQATTDPGLHRRLLDTHEQVWVSLLWGHCFFLWGPGTYKVLFVPSKILFPQCCVSLGSSVMGTSSKRAYAIPSLLHPEPPPLRQSTADPHLLMRHSDSSVSVPVVSLGPGAHKACLNLLSISGGHWVWF